ncbi:tRNA 2-selenouridine(34) synthase MnmH [Candidatus Clostridium stratigraminis]|uniref:tRNA 2-selenouridine(34) synthase MnmH n=1 Tax=Candidatus Clostridium stratigraminis TaxID=3381661 RepID=A0ABW8T940_9CLOT
MFKSINYCDLKGNFALIDVRSPMEYKEATIPGAINIPIFDNEERKEIGYVYVNENVERAKYLGVQAVSKKLPKIYNEVSKLDKEYDKLILFCARGGMRSSSLCGLLTTLGLNTYKLSGGYKAYRGYINEMLPKENEKVKYIVLHGKTGVGKTRLLYNLKRNGMDVLDLEEAANHRGSLLGSVGLKGERSQKHFESLVFNSLIQRKSNFIFVEGESKRIGNIIIPEFIYSNMEAGIHLLVDADIEYRCELILEEYTKKENSKEDILKSLDLLSKYISNKNISKYKDFILNDRYYEVAKELMLKYYDPMYQSSIEKYNYELQLNIWDLEMCTEKIIKWAKENFLL